MAQMFTGNCIGKAVNVEFGADMNGKARVRWEMEVTEGEHKGKRAQYSGKLDDKQIKWTKRDMMTIGWKGKDVRTFVADVTAANLLVPFEAQIASHEGREWTAAKLSGALPLGKLDDDAVAKANQWFSEAEDIGSPAAPADNGHAQPPHDDDSIPF